MNDVKHLHLMTPEEREDWLRWRKRGLLWVLLLFAGIFALSIGSVLIVLSIAIGFWQGIPLYVRVFCFFALGSLVSIPVVSVVGTIFWFVMEKRYRASVEYFPSDAELKEHTASERRDTMTLAPLGLGALCLFLPKPFSFSLAFVCWGFTPFLLVYSSCKDGAWDYRGATIPLNDIRARFQALWLILIGIASIVLGIYLFLSS